MGRFGKKKDRSVDARLSQSHSLLDQGHRQAGGTCVDRRRGDRGVTVPIAIGLYDGAHL
jgi:hypothetical protein